MFRSLYHQGLLDAAAAHKLGQLESLLAQVGAFLAQRYTIPVSLRTYALGVFDHSPGNPPEATTNNKQQTPNHMSLETSIQNLADAINNLAKAGITAPATNVVPIASGKPAAAPAAAAKPAAAAEGAKAETPQAAALRKAREAKAAQAKAKAEAEAAAAAEEAEDTSLLDGTDEAAGTVTLEDLRALGMQILKLKRQPQMKELLEGLGATSITTLPEEQYEAAQEGLQAIIDL